MTETLLLFVGMLLILLPIAYTVWVRARVILLREAMFEIRDELWDTARELDLLNDPAHRATRNHLNSCIHAADWISVGVIQMASDANPDNAVVSESANPELTKAIKLAYENLAFKIATYALFHRLSGWLFVLTTGANYFFKQMTKIWVLSKAPEYLNQMELQRTPHPPLHKKPIPSHG